MLPIPSRAALLLSTAAQARRPLPVGVIGAGAGAPSLVKAAARAGPPGLDAVSRLAHAALERERGQRLAALDAIGALGRRRMAELSAGAAAAAGAETTAAAPAPAPVATTGGGAAAAGADTTDAGAAAPTTVATTSAAAVAAATTDAGPAAPATVTVAGATERAVAAGVIAAPSAKAPSKRPRPPSTPPPPWMITTEAGAVVQGRSRSRSRSRCIAPADLELLHASPTIRVETPEETRIRQQQQQQLATTGATAAAAAETTNGAALTGQLQQLALAEPTEA